GSARSAARPGLAACAVGGGRAGSCQGDPGPIHGAGAVPGDRGQDLEPPGTGGRPPAGSQWTGDGCVQAVPRGSLTGVATLTGVVFVDTFLSIVFRYSHVQREASR